MPHPSCILCKSPDTDFYYEDNIRSYYQCPKCNLVFVPPYQYLSPEEEKKRYDLHENDPLDEGYRKFLSRLMRPLNCRLAPGSQGLDFGCGPGPTLHLMLEEQGHQMNIYDPFYNKDPSVFDTNYDFITATEVVEHLHNPSEELDLLWRCLKPRGYLGIMTKMVRNRQAFRNWHYIRDETHVAFFSRNTFEWLAGRWNASLDFPENDVIILQKESEAN